MNEPSLALGGAESAVHSESPGLHNLNDSIFQDAGWYRAVTLAERAKRNPPSANERQNEGPVNRKRPLRWRSEPPFTNAALFALRLAMDGLSEGQFETLLDESVESLCNRCPAPPSWLTRLAEAFSDSSSRLNIISEHLANVPTIALLNVIEPLIASSLIRLHANVERILFGRPGAPIDIATIRQILVPELLRQLAGMVGRTMVLELNVARLEGHLEGDTPKDRFCSFVKRIHHAEIGLAILHEYPVLARQLTTCLDQWVAFVTEFLERLVSDWELIRSSLSPDEDPGVLVNVQCDAGDRHRNGRTVLIVKFSSGFPLVYKPKSLAVDVHFEELLAWINERGDHPPFRTMRVLNRGNYGWAEFVAHECCDSLPALRRFYERQGAYLALLYLLCATDFHCDNLIAAGEHPMLVDLEALFHPPLPQGPDDLEISELADSVLNVGLLPWRDLPSAESEGIDISGLGGAPGQMTPHALPDWEQAGTDEMRLTRRRMKMLGAHNQPSLSGSDVNLRDYAEEITKGFSKVYRLFLRHRDELLSPDGPLNRFANDEVRVIARATTSYAVLLTESFHPDVLRDALDRDLLFDRLWLAVESCPWLAKLISAEVEDLQQGDIPLFTARPGRRDIWTSSNHCIRDFFSESALAVVRRHSLQLGERDLDLQLWLIRASLATTAIGHDGAKERAPYKLSGHAATRDQVLRAARSAGDRIESVAIRGDGKSSWVGLTLSDENHWSVAPLGMDLYDGLPGVGLFLACLGDQTGDCRYTDLAREACATMVRYVERNRSWIRSIGAFDGWGGIIYALTHLSTLWGEPGLLMKATDVVAALPPLIEKDEHFDIVAGAAGCIGALLALHNRAPAEEVRAAAVRCGDHLLAHAQQTENGLGWIIPQEVRPLAGFAHGAAGIAWALLKLAALTGQDRFRTTALAAIRHERSLFSEQAGNWHDLRVHAKVDSNGKVNGDSCVTAWCHGAPGIGLARLSTFGQVNDDETRREIEIALHTTLTYGFGANHSLCHGDLGNIELLLQAEQILSSSEWRAQAYNIAGNIVESVTRNKYLCGTPLNIDSPGLMTGLAGIGYGLLRLAKPERVPCVLTLEPPPSGLNT